MTFDIILFFWVLLYSSRIISFSRDSCYCLLKNFRSQDLDIGCICCYWGIIFSMPFKRKKLGNACMIIQLYIHMYIHSIPLFVSFILFFSFFYIFSIYLSTTLIQYHIIHSSLPVCVYVTSFSSHEKHGSHHLLFIYLFLHSQYIAMEVSEFLTYTSMGNNFMN